MIEYTYRDDVTVELTDHLATDEGVVRRARVSTIGRNHDVESDPIKDAGLINYLVRERHGSPFEHNLMTFYIEAPIFVFRELATHRIGVSINEESGRYRELRPIFYIPGPDRKLVQQGKPGSYEFVEGNKAQHDIVAHESKSAYREAYRRYLAMLEAGIAREVAREVLPVGLFSSAYISFNSRSLMHFLGLRTKHEEATFKSSPQREIEMLAEKMEAAWADLMPWTHECFNRHGRVAP